MLLEKEQLDLNISNMNGERALYMATFTNERKLVKMLIEKGAKIEDDVNSPTAINKYVPSLSLIKKSDFIFNNSDIPYKIKILFSDFKKYIKAVFFKKYNEEEDTKTIHEIFNRFINGDKSKSVYDQIIHSTINETFYPDYLPKGETNTILMSTIKSGLDMYNISRVVSLLLEKGANPHIKNNEGETAIQVSMGWDDDDMIKLLLNYCHEDHMKALKISVKEGSSDKTKIFDDIYRRKCIICDENQVDNLFNCGHAILCNECYTKLPTPKLCPLCREPINDRYSNIESRLFQTDGKRKSKKRKSKKRKSKKRKSKKRKSKKIKIKSKKKITKTI